MNNLTKIKIHKPAHEVFGVFVDSAKIENFWFSYSSERWEAGKTITGRYDEYDTEVIVEITEIKTNKNCF